MRYTTALTGLEFYAYHGLYAEERVLGQLFRVDMKVTTSTDKPVTTLDDAVNYELLYRVAQEEMAKSRELVEMVAQDILERLRQYFGSQSSIEVTLYKPNPAGVFKSGVASVTFSV